MKKILFFIESLSGGGAEKVLTDLVSNLDKTKYDITVCSLVDIGVYNAYLKEICNYKSVLGNPDILSSFSRITYKIKYLLFRKLPPQWIYKFLNMGHFDTEIAFIEGFATKIIGSSTNKKSNKIAWVHIDLFANHWTSKEYKSLEEEVRIYKNFNHIVSVAESVQQAFSKRFNITNSLCVKYNPVDRNEIIKKSKDPIENLDSNNKKIRLVTVGRLEPQKGYDRLLEVIYMLKSEGFNIELWIIGEGTKRNELENYITSNQLQNDVILKGFQTNPYKFIENSDAFVCSSRSEGFSTVVTEALILGKPVVATDCSGMKELLGDSEFGLITKNNTDDLYVGLKKFLSDQNLRDHYTKKSNERSADFDIKATIKSIEDLL